MPPEQLLAWLQAYVERDAAAWEDYWEPMTQIAERLAVPRDGPAGRIEGAGWRLILDPVDLAG